MINTYINKYEHHGHIVLCPNMSARWQTTKLFLYIVSAVALTIGLVFAALGAWIVLPFSGIEILVLYIVMYRVSRKCHQQEVIYLTEQGVKVEQGVNTPDHTWESDLFWTRLVVKPGSHPWHPRKVVLRGRHDQIEIGAFLNDEDKELLIKQLQGLIVAV